MLKNFITMDGQELRWREYGCSGGEPVFFFHGWPGEAAQAGMIHAAAAERGLWIIAPNRPGIGGSSRQPGRTLLDWPPIMTELADSLRIGRFRILGLSGGGPYALACAWALGERVRHTATVCGALPAGPGADRRFLSPVYRLMLAAHDHAPWLLKGLLVPAVRVARVRPPRPVLWLALRSLDTSDRAALWPREDFARYFPAFRNAMRSGMRGLWEDGHPYAGRWPFDPAEIRTPLTLWHGAQDRNFNCDGARVLAARIPQAVFVRTEDGHYSILRNQAEAVLDDLTGRHPAGASGTVAA